MSHFFSLIRRYVSRPIASVLARPGRRRSRRPHLEALESRWVPATFTESEPNNTQAQGNVITLVAGDVLDVTATLETNASQDWFVFTLTARSGVFFDADSRETGLSTSFDSLIGLYASNGTLLDDNNNGFDFDTGSPAPVGVPGAARDSALYADLAPGTYAIQVTSFNGASSGDYLLRVRAEQNYSSTPVALNSLPGAVDTIFLDFNGHAATDTWGTYNVGGFDLSGNTAEFTPGEQLAITNIWRTVAEDYSPFNINVSTNYAGSFANGVAMRVVFANDDGSAVGVDGALGVAFLNSYVGSAVNTCFVFVPNFFEYTGTGTSAQIVGDTLEMGNTTAHEVGHTLGLEHYSSFDGSADPADTIPNGIMATPDLGLNREIWAVGINSSGDSQNDMAVISSTTNTFGYRADDHGGTTVTATTLSASGNVYSASGVIAQQTDVDVFRFVGSGATTIRVDVNDYASDLNSVVALLDASGTEIARNDPSNSFDAFLSQTLPAGTYFVVVSSTQAAGESGQYALNITTVLAPVANDGSLSTNEDTSVSGTLSATGTGTLTYRVVSGPTRGTLTSFDAATGTFVYQPNPNYHDLATPDSFTFVASVAGLDSNVATESITVLPVADTPSVTNATTNEDVQTTSGLVVSRNAADGPEVTHFQITGISNGTLFQNNGTTQITNGTFLSVVQANAGLRFTPSPNFSGTATFLVQASLSNTNAGLGGSTVTASITVNPVADTPSITNASTNEDTQTTSGLVVSRNAADGPEVSHVRVTAIANGTLFLSDGTTPVANNSFITFAQANAGLKFTPAANFFGTSTFNVQASTSASVAGLGGGVITASITVNPLADTPSVTGATTNEDVQTTSGLVVSRNAADGPEVTHFQITGISNGTLFQNNGTTQIANGTFLSVVQANAGLRFTPSPNFSGTATFLVQSSLSNTNAGLGGSIATVSITVNPVADTPSVTGATTNEDAPTTSGLVISSNAVDGPEVTHFRITGIGNGTLFQNDGTTPIANGSFLSVAQANAGLRFTPSPNFSGTATFLVRASLNNTNAGLGGSTVTASITVNPVADTPSVTNATTNEDVQTTSGLVVLRNAADGPEVSHVRVTAIANGTLFLSDGTTPVANDSFITFAQANAGLRFTPAVDQNSPSTTFAFDVQASTSASIAGLSGDVITATITVNPATELPSVTNATTNEDAQTTSGLVVSRNAADGPEVTHFQILGISNGTLFQNDGITPIANGSFITIAQGGSGLKFSPNPNFFGEAAFRVRSGIGSAGVGLGPLATATITVNPVADTPSATNATTNEDVQTTSGLVLTVNPADGPEVTHFQITGISNGTLFLNDGVTPIANGSFITVAQGGSGLQFAPAANFFGIGTFQALASVGTSVGGGATATITVSSVNDPPTATDDVVVASAITTFDVLANDSSLPDVGEPLTLVSVTQGSAGGKVSIRDGLIKYRPLRGLGGVETFTYAISDGLLTSTATVTVNLTPPNAILPPNAIVIGSNGGGPATVRILDATTRAVVGQLTPYDGFQGGIHVALGDVNGDGYDEVIVATAGTVAHVKVIDGVTGQEIRSFKPFGDYPSGLELAAGDVDGDEFDDVILGNETGISHVVAFSGRTNEQLFSQIAFEGYLGGVRLAAGDVDGDGRADVAVVAGPGGNGHVKAFDVLSGGLLRSYLGYPGYVGEVELAIAQLTSGPTIVTTALNPGLGTHVKGESGVDNAQVLSYFVPVPFGGPLTTVRPASPSKFARVAAADFNRDGVDDLVFINGPGEETLVLVQDGATQGVVDLLFAFDAQYNRGGFVAAG